MPAYPSWFTDLTGHSPHPWQAALAHASTCDNRLIRIPTGMGKTLGVLSAWSYHRLVRGDASWPRRLVLCLPMRVLVEQTEAVVRDWLTKLGKLWVQDNQQIPAPGEVGVHVVLGGATPRDWHLFPEHEAVLVGTQDMLLSRALNRGYGSARGRWPMEHALLRQDALWVFDEVQLMDVGLRTAVQLQAFHEQASARSTRPLRSWWMSATLQPEWLSSVDFETELAALRELALRVPAKEREGALFEAQKPMRVETIAASEDRHCESWAQVVIDAHTSVPRREHGRLTLAIANTVDDARSLYNAIHKCLGKASLEDVDLRLIHSRFRGRERARWQGEFLNRKACTSGADRIVIATQVVEAGVDISANALVTALAPWPSLVQRFGRAARYGGSASIVVVDRLVEGKAAAPYEEGELAAARRVLAGVHDVGLASLEALEERLAAEDRALLQALYPYHPLHTLTGGEYTDLFDTGPDLTGSDLDISRFIRSGEERDLQVWWWPIPLDEDPEDNLQPMREALCPVPVHKAQEWLLGAKEDRPRAWQWSYLDGAWKPLTSRSKLPPGIVVLVDTAAGGYTMDRGFVGADDRAAVPCDPSDRKGGRDSEDPQGLRLLAADNAQDHEDLSEFDHYKTIAFHGREAGEEARSLALAMDLAEPLPRLLELAARLHDLGKAHEVFQRAIVAPAFEERSRQDLAKAPQAAWKRPDPFARPGFRHELASTLAILELLYQTCPLHPGLMGRYSELIEIGALVVDAADRQHMSAEHPAPAGVLAELAILEAHELDLVLYLVCAHHGKVRGSWQQTPQDQTAQSDPKRGLPLRGVIEGDAFPATAIADAHGDTSTILPAVKLHLDPAQLGLSGRYGASWRERVEDLRRRYSDPMLVLLETLLRVADIRASRRMTIDPWIGEEIAR